MILIENLKHHGDGHKQIFGDVFFRNFYATFDVDSSKMGLAVHNKPEITVATTDSSPVIEIINNSAGVTLLTASLALFTTYLL